MSPLQSMQKVMISFGKRSTCGSTRRSRFSKVLPLVILAIFVYNSFENSSVALYRQLYEASEKTTIDESRKLNGKFKYCRTPYVKMDDLLTSVPLVIPPKDRMDPPSHIQLCKAFLDRADLDESQLEALPIISVTEDPAVCVDGPGTHYSVLSLFGSSAIAAKGPKLRYSHNCHRFIPHTREGHTHYDYTTLQEILPENLISAKDADSIDVDLVKDLCNRCIDDYENDSLPESYDSSTNHCFLFPGGAVANSLVQQKRELPLSSILSSFVDRMRHATEDWIDATSAIKNEDESGVIIYIDEHSKVMDFSVYEASFPFVPSSIQIFASASCAVASLRHESDCIKHGSMLKTHFINNFKFKNTYVRYDIVASTATSYARMMKAKISFIAPGTMALLPALGKLAGKKAFVAEDGSLPGTFHWFENLIVKRKELGFQEIGYDAVSDEEYLIISEESIKPLPGDLPLGDLDSDEDTPPQDDPFDLPLDQLLGIDTIAPPVERTSTGNADGEGRESSQILTTSNDESLHVTDFNNLIDTIANDVRNDVDEIEVNDGKSPVEVAEEAALGSTSEEVLAEVTEEVAEVTEEVTEEGASQQESELEIESQKEAGSQGKEVAQYENSETSVDVERTYEEVESDVSISEPKMSEISMPEMSEVEVQDYAPNFNDFSFAGRSSGEHDSPEELQPVYDFWDDVNEDHTFHFGEPWEGEIKGNVQYLAYPSQAKGTEPVYKFWNGDLSEYTFHLGDPWEGEVKQSVVFYAYPDDMEGLDLLPVEVYWNESQKSHTFHAGSPWSGETRQGDIAFYAPRTL